MTEPQRFDQAYYRRFYEDPSTRVTDAATIARLSGFVCSYLDHLSLPLRNVLDLGCGTGLWGRALAQKAPRARYQGVEISEYLCEKYGWRRGSVVDFRGRGQFDLVVCQGVLQYLERDEAVQAIENLARLCRGALYLEALTTRDWQENVDREITDGDVKLRSGDWYRRQLRPHFHNAGGGVFVARGAPVSMFELEAL